MTYKAIYEAIMQNIDAMNMGADEKYRYHAKKLKINRCLWHETGRHVNPFIYTPTNLFFFSIGYLTVNPPRNHLPKKPIFNLFSIKAYILPSVSHIMFFCTDFYFIYS